MGMLGGQLGRRWCSLGRVCDGVERRGLREKGGAVNQMVQILV